MGVKIIVGKSELARALGYSREKFFRMVHGNRIVMENLEKVGYAKRLHSLTPKMIDAICEYYGYPMEMEKE